MATLESEFMRLFHAVYVLLPLGVHVCGRIHEGIYSVRELREEGRKEEEEKKHKQKEK